MNILIKPIVTEKMNSMGEALNRFGFIVDKRANKIEIKLAVQKLYGVTVESVNTINYGGKRKSQNTKSGVINGKAKSNAIWRKKKQNRLCWCQFPEKGKRKSP